MGNGNSSVAGRNFRVSRTFILAGVLVLSLAVNATLFVGGVIYDVVDTFCRECDRSSDCLRTSAPGSEQVAEAKPSAARAGTNCSDGKSAATGAGADRSIGEPTAAEGGANARDGKSSAAGSGGAGADNRRADPKAFAGIGSAEFRHASGESIAIRRHCGLRCDDWAPNQRSL